MAKKKTSVTEIEGESTGEVLSYTLLRGPLLHDGEVYQEGCVVNLTAAQLAALPAGMVTAGPVESSGEDA